MSPSANLDWHSADLSFCRRKARGAFSDQSVAVLKEIIVNEAQVLKVFRQITSKADMSSVDGISDDSLYGSCSPVGLTVLSGNAPIVQPVGNTICFPPIRHDSLEDSLDNGAFPLVDHQIPDRLVFLIDSTLMLQAITEGHETAAIEALLNH